MNARDSADGRPCGGQSIGNESSRLSVSHWSGSRRFIISLAVCLSACATQLGQAPVVDPRFASEVVVVHSSVTTSGSQTLTLDNQTVALLSGGVATRLTVQPGPHWLGVGCSAALGLSWTEEHLTLFADPRTTYFFQATPTQRCARLQPLGEAATRALLEHGTAEALARSH